VALSPSPFATVSKQSVLGALEATGSHDPDVLERERSHLLSVARFASSIAFCGSPISRYDDARPTHASDSFGRNFVASSNSLIAA